jgi:hypothetical protein
LLREHWWERIAGRRLKPAKLDQSRLKKPQDLVERVTLTGLRLRQVTMAPTFALEASLPTPSSSVFEVWTEDVVGDSDGDCGSVFIFGSLLHWILKVVLQRRMLLRWIRQALALQFMATPRTVKPLETLMKLARPVKVMTPITLWNQNIAQTKVIHSQWSEKTKRTQEIVWRSQNKVVDSGVVKLEGKGTLILDLKQKKLKRKNDDLRKRLPASLDIRAKDIMECNCMQLYRYSWFT